MEVAGGIGMRLARTGFFGIGLGVGIFLEFSMSKRHVSFFLLRSRRRCGSLLLFAMAVSVGMLSLRCCLLV